MLKPCKFPQANFFLPATTFEGGKSFETTYHFYREPEGKFSVACVDLTDEDIKKLAETRKLWVIVPREMIPFQLEVVSPFTPKIIGLNGHNLTADEKDKDAKDSNSPSAGDNK